MQRHGALLCDGRVRVLTTKSLRGVLAACALVACASESTGDAGPAQDGMAEVAILDASDAGGDDVTADLSLLPIVPVGGVCDPNELADRCSTGASCVGTGTMARCVGEGVRGGRCRAATMAVRCDAGLVCDDDLLSPTCRTTVAVGERCDPAGVTNLCVTPARCTTAMGASICRTAPYVESRLTAPTFVNACAMGGMRVALGGAGRDDAHAATALTMPFGFRFFGAEYTRVWPSTNGYAVFGVSAPQDRAGGADRFPADEGPLVAAFWADLVLRAGPGSDLCALTSGTAPNRQFVLEWLDAYHTTYDTTHLTFEVVLTETTNTVDIIYSRLDPTANTTAEYVHGALATIGLQSDRGAQFLAHPGTVATTAGVRFTPR